MSQTGGLTGGNTGPLDADANFDNSDGFHPHSIPPFYPEESTTDTHVLLEAIIDSDMDDSDDSLSVWNINWVAMNHLLGIEHSIPSRSDSESLPEYIRSQLRKKYLLLIMRLNFIFKDDDRFVGLLVNLTQYTKYVEQNDLSTDPSALEHSVNLFINVLRTTCDCLMVFIQEIPMVEEYKELRNWCILVQETISSDLRKVENKPESDMNRELGKPDDLSEMVFASIFDHFNPQLIINDSLIYSRLLELENERSLVIRLSDFGLTYAKSRASDIPESAFTDIIDFIRCFCGLNPKISPTADQVLRFINDVIIILKRANPNNDSNLSSDLNTIVRDLNTFRQKYRERYSAAVEP